MMRYKTYILYIIYIYIHIYTFLFRNCHPVVLIESVFKYEYCMTQCLGIRASTRQGNLTLQPSQISKKHHPFPQEISCLISKSTQRKWTCCSHLLCETEYVVAIIRCYTLLSVMSHSNTNPVVVWWAEVA
jgi:hypothetical protein